ncbi:hypothetical protein BCF44_105154 [Kutzneria buriramensis]|uniref:Uncharacterized protein n=1 Tax=Kutzneria buriramensis TaxID=1045776 RepID=A0A3E0HPY0_9PSEU|nr:hypothetical protein BCF44_105154 [Kutzneria buriramensis]
MTRYLLPLLCAVLLTGVVCSVVFGSVCALTWLDDWLAERAEHTKREGRSDD